MEQNTVLNVDDQLKELFALQPIVVTFRGKQRQVHFFHYGTAERFSEALKGTSGSESQRRRKQREVRLLSIVLSDLYGSSPYFLGLRRWFWKLRLSHSTYSDIEAMKLLEAASSRIQNGKVMDALATIMLTQIQGFIDSMNTGKLIL